METTIFMNALRGAKKSKADMGSSVGKRFQLLCFHALWGGARRKAPLLFWEEGVIMFFRLCRYHLQMLLKDINSEMLLYWLI